jgi:hypothetical protein
MMQDGVCIERHEGTPQGGPLSPMLANLLLDDPSLRLGQVWTRNWNEGATGSAGMPMTATSTCGRRRRESG